MDYPKGTIAPLGGGVAQIIAHPASPESALRQKEYLSNDYCLSCTYFREAKGHLGSCSDNMGRGIYDGAKKGSACVVWRKKSVWEGIEFELPSAPVRIKRKLVRRNDAPWVFEKLGSIIPAGLPAADRLRDNKVIGRGHGLGSHRTAKVKAILSERTKAAWDRGDFGPRKPPRPMPPKPRSVMCYCGNQFPNLRALKNHKWEVHST